VAKVRVHELAKELGISSKEALTKLQDMGEFVRSASSTIEPPVVKKLRSAYAGSAPKIGRESCRERVKFLLVAETVK